MDILERRQESAARLRLYIDRLGPVECTANVDGPDCGCILCDLRIVLNPMQDMVKPRSGYIGVPKRQLEVLKLLAEGLGNKIAVVLNISPYTVAEHKKQVFKKLNAKTSIEATALAIKLGLI